MNKVGCIASSLVSPLIQNPHCEINQAIRDKIVKISEALKNTPFVVQDNIISISSPKTRLIQGKADGG